MANSGAPFLQDIKRGKIAALSRKENNRAAVFCWLLLVLTSGDAGPMKLLSEAKKAISAHPPESEGKQDEKNDPHKCYTTALQGKNSFFISHF